MIDRISVCPAMTGVVSPIVHSPTNLRSSLVVGLKALGIQVLVTSAIVAPTQYAACWGWRIGNMLRKRGKQVLVMERGYIGDRFAYTSLGWNGLNNYAEFPAYADDGGERFRAHGGVIKPWREGGDYVLILGQVRGDQSLQGRDLTAWYAKAADAARNYYGKPVYFRPHPLAGSRGFSKVPGVKELPPCGLDEALSGAMLTVAYNSNSCLDSVLAGVPCYAGDRGTMAWDLCSPDIRRIVRPERESTAHRIAWTQWARYEIESGEALRRLVDV